MKIHALPTLFSLALIGTLAACQKPTPPATAPAPAAPSAAPATETASAPPAAAMETSEPTAIPDTADAIWLAIDQHTVELKATIASGDLKSVHHHAFAIRDLVAALPAHSPSLPAEEQSKLGEDVKFVATLADRLDQSGDASDQAGSQANFEQLSAVLTGMTRYK